MLVGVLGAIGILAVGASSWIYAAPLPFTQPGPIRSDGLGYYAYLPATFLDRDLTMRRTAVRSFGGDPAAIPGVRWARTTVPLGQPGQHQYLDQYGIGEAVLLTPFFAAAYGLAVVMNQPTGGFSWPFEASVVGAALVFMLLGLALTASVLARWFSRRTVLITLLALTFGAAVFNYATFEPSMSHVYSFFAVALVLRVTLWVWDRPGLARASALGGAVGLVGLIRPTNLTLVLFCALVGVERFSDLSSRGRTLVRHIGLVGAGCAVFLLTMLPQFAYWHRITGAWITNPYRGPGEHLDLSDPHLIGVLFSVRKGLFFWTPLVVLAVAGLPLLRRTARPVFLASIVYLPVAVWVVASWSIWWYGVSFGMRALIDEMPVFALGLAAFIEVARAASARLALAAVAVTSVLGVHAMLAYWLFVIPGDKTTLHQYFESLQHW